MNEIALASKVTIHSGFVSTSSPKEREAKERTERFLFPQYSNDDTSLNDEIDERSSGGPNDGQNEQPNRV